MSRIGSLPRRLGTTWTYALVGGVASIPFTTFLYWQSGNELSLTPVFFGGLLAGYLAKRHGGETAAVGFRAGMIGALPVIWVVADIFGAATALAGPLWFLATASAMTLGFATVVVGLALGLGGLVGVLGGRVGAWIAERRGGAGTAVVSN